MTTYRTVRRKAESLHRHAVDRRHADAAAHGILDTDDTAWLQFLTPKEQKELDELLLDVRPTLTFLQFIRLVKPEFEVHWYHAVLIRVLQDVADGRRTRVMIFMPPRHGKSELVSRIFPAYYLYRHQSRRVGLVSYGAELAYELAAAARDLFFHHDDGESTASRATKNWRTKAGGGMWADGIGGTLTGKGANLLILDDPTKNAQEAASPTVQRRNIEWYASTFSSRKQRRIDGVGSAIVVVGTRWNENDILGWLLKTERGANERTAERWHIVCFQAIKDAEDLEEWPEWCTSEDAADPREEGEPLNPQWFTLEDLLREKAKGNHYFAALYQQRPRPRDGMMFKWEWFKVLKEAYTGPGHVVMHFDLAGTDASMNADADYTAGCCMVLTPDRRFIIHRVRRQQLSPAKRDQFIRNCATAVEAEFGKHRLHLGLERESGIGAQDRIDSAVRTLAGFNIYIEPAVAAKHLRAEPLAAQAELGNVYIVEGDWNGEFLDEMTSFGPDGQSNGHDDMVDAASGAFNKLVALADREVPLVPPVLGALYSPFDD